MEQKFYLDEISLHAPVIIRQSLNVLWILRQKS